MKRQKVRLAILCLSVFPLTTAQNLSAAQRTAPVDPVQVNRDVRAGTQNLERDANSALREFQRLTREVDKLKSQANQAKRKAEEAARAAERARDEALKCKTDRDKQRILGLVNEAKKKQKEAQEARERTDQMEKDLVKRLDDVGSALDRRINELQETLGKGFKAAKDQGLADTSVTTGNLRDAQAMLDRELAKQRSEGTKEKNFEDRGSLDRVRQARNEFNPKIREAKEQNDSSKALEQADSLIKGAEALLDRCPPQVGAAPKTPTEVFVAVDNRLEVLACISPGQDPREAINALGLGKKYQMLVSGPTGTIVKGVGDAKTVEKNAQAKGVNLCFKPENDYCTIMTPLTPFRGHDHKAHEQSGRGPHDHDGPDPGPDWGVTPPKIVVRLE